MSEDQSPARRKAYQRAKDPEGAGLSRPERLEFASFLLRRDVTSWDSLDEEQILRVLDAIEGWELIQALHAMRPPA